MKTFLLGFACVGALVLGGGCTSSSDDQTAGPDTSGIPTCASDGTQLGYTCTQGWSATMSPYILNDNQWGVAGAIGEQCVWGTCQDGDTIGWVTNWDWKGGTNWVLSYASVVFGWHWGFPVANTGLPIQISSGKAVNCGWTFALTGTSGSFNVAYDLWLHDTAAPPSSGGQTGEIMIWLNTQNGAGPAGTVAASGVWVAGSKWNLWVGDVGWPVYSYVRTSNTTAAVFDVMAFLNDLVARNYVRSEQYLSSVQAGIEVRKVNTSGTLTTNGFYCRIE
ncbi:MAG TPA: endo-1,4-beta-glucanase [Polyangia bacterium]